MLNKNMQAPLIKIRSAEAITANGLNKEAVFKACIEGRSAVNSEGLAILSDELIEKLKLNTPPEFLSSKSSLVSYYTLKSCLDQSGWDANELKETGFIFASTTSKIDVWEKELPFHLIHKNSKTEISKIIEAQSLGFPLVELKNHFHIDGPVATVASSCSASLQALSVAYFWLTQGKVKRCIVGSTEILSDLTKVGFGSLRLLSKTICKPFDKNRNGINLGEASAFLCLEIENENMNGKTADESLGYILGAGLSTDAYHPTAPQPEGLGSARAMQSALNLAQIPIETLKWFYSHGTGSMANDLAEARAIHTLLGNEIKNENLVLTTSTKSIHGHTLGASGILETILGLLAVKNKTCLPTFNYETDDPEIDLKIAKREDVKTDSSSEYLNSGLFLKNSLGFGGINASLLCAGLNAKGSLKSINQKSVLNNAQSIQKELLTSAKISDAEVDLESTDPVFRKATLNMIMAYEVCKKVLDQAQEILGHSIDHSQLAMILSTQFGEVSSSLDFLKTYKQTQIPRPILFQNSLHNSTLGFVTMNLKIQGPAITLSSDRYSDDSVHHTGDALLTQSKYLLICFVDCVPEELKDQYLQVFPYAQAKMNRATAQLWVRK